MELLLRLFLVHVSHHFGNYVSCSLSFHTQLAVGVVLLEGGGVEVDASVGLVGVAVVDDALNHVDNLLHVLSITGYYIELLQKHA